MQREFVESMKTIAQSAVERAGFDKTRNGKIVGVKQFACDFWGNKILVKKIKNG